MASYRTLIVIPVLVFFAAVAYSQGRTSLSVADIEGLLRAGVTAKRLVTLIEERGINFDLTEETKAKFRAAGGDALFIQALERAAAEKAAEKDVYLGPYQVLYPTRVYSEPREDSTVVARIPRGMKVNVVGARRDWLEVRSRHGNPPGFIKKDSAVPLEK